MNVFCKQTTMVIWSAHLFPNIVVQASQLNLENMLTRLPYSQELFTSYLGEILGEGSVSEH